MKQVYEYSGPYRWDEARERIPNDYRTKDDKRTEYQGSPMSSEELAEYYDKLAEMENDGLPVIY